MLSNNKIQINFFRNELKFSLNKLCNFVIIEGNL